MLKFCFLRIKFTKEDNGMKVISHFKDNGEKLTKIIEDLLKNSIQKS